MKNRKNIPDTMEYQEIVKRVSDGFERAKGGDAADVYAEVAKYQADGVLPLKSHYAFGWIIYYALHQSAPNAIKERKQMLARYLSLQVEKPHKLHSMILTDATGTNYWLTPSRFGFSEDMPIGTPLKIKIFAGKVVRASV